MAGETFKPKVVLALIEDDGEFLLIKRKVKERHLLWAFPGGKTKPGETEEESMVREAKEEVTLDVEVVRKLLERKHPNTYVTVAYFYCRLKDSKSQAKIGEEYEIEQIDWVPAAEVLERFTSDVAVEIRDFILSFIPASARERK